MLFETNKEKGRAGLASAIGYFGTHGYTVSIPLNDTQDYDILVDKDNVISRISIKATSQRSPYGITICDLRNTGGTKGKVYGLEKNKKIDYIFVVNEKQEMWLLPISVINNRSVTLGTKYEKYKMPC